MKKRLLALSLALLIVLSLISGCGASSMAKSADSVANYAVQEPAAAPMPMPEEQSYENGFSSYDYDVSEGELAEDDAGVDASEPTDYSEKIIYSADTQLETLHFDDALEGIAAMVEEFGGFIESSSVSGSNYYDYARGYETYRSAHYTLRIPSEHFREVTSRLSSLGNVPYCNIYTDNVTASYYDTRSRLIAYETQETRLLELLEMAETVEDILLIQAQLTDVQYEIDSLETTLRIYDRRVAYSTVNLNVTEVEEYTEQPVVVLSYWQRMANGFTRSLKSVGTFFTDLFMWLVSNLPALIVIAIVIVVLIIILRRVRRNRIARRGEDWKPASQRRAEKKEARLARKAAKKESKN